MISGGKKANVNVLEVGRRVLLQEAEAVTALVDRLGASFEEAVDLIFSCAGRVIVAGMGKSGQISRKIAATLASTGTPAQYLHPSDALHGDLGMVGRGDVLLAVSNSGETEDLLKLLPSLKYLQVPMVAILGQTDSSLGREADIVLDAWVEREACPMDLAPTTSSTAALALGDALAMALLEQRDFRPEDFALFHPGGALGKKLLTTVSDLMHSGDALPLVDLGTPMDNAIEHMTLKRLGITGVVDASGRLVGALTDGDLRRALEKGGEIKGAPVEKFMTPSPKVIDATALAITSLNRMEDHSITSLFIIESEDEGKPVGLIHIHDILRSGINR
ncbi:MAG: KpsF/GutQ family sugar-phosphate isomerase [Candidatus Marinimicrobia bacterium]|nr:KpsF/GutQ family sugar-phosphate isomerase [Candidatus Neomarinimicrobiota bacterium]